MAVSNELISSQTIPEQRKNKMASEKVQKEIDNFANHGPKLHRRRPLSDRPQVMSRERYYDSLWKYVLKEMWEEEIISCFL